MIFPRFTCSVFLILASLLANAQQQDENVTVGLSVWSGYPESVRGFKEAMADGGFMEDKNITYLFGKSDGDKTKQGDIAKQFKEEEVDLVYTLTTPGTVIVKETLPPTTPIVFSIVTYPADSGLIESFEYSGNNLVGTSNYVPFKEYVNLLTTLMPKTKSVAIFHRKGEPNSKIQTAGLTRAFKKKGIQAFDAEVETIEQVTSLALKLLEQVDVFITTTDTLMQNGGEQALIEISKAKNLPILSSNKSGIEGGSTFGPAADFYTLGLMSGRKAVQILRDKQIPASLSSEYMDPPLTLVNKKRAEALGIKIPKQLLASVRWVE